MIRLQCNCVNLLKHGPIMKFVFKGVCCYASIFLLEKAGTILFSVMIYVWLLGGKEPTQE